jgi:hypothetical protein
MQGAGTLKRPTVIVAATLACLAVSTSTTAKEKPFEVWTETDQFLPQMTVVTSTPITIKPNQFLNPWFASLQAKYLFDKKHNAGFYVFDITYIGQSWVFWDTLAIKLSVSDVRRLEPLVPPTRDVQSLGILLERIRFSIPAEAMTRLANMSQVDMRVSGKTYYDFYLNATGTGWMRMLMAKVAQVAPGAADSSADKAPSAVQGQPATGSRDYIAELRELAKLHEEGILTEEEFATKKRQILSADASLSHQAAETPSKPPLSPLVATIDGTVGSKTDEVTTIKWVLRITSNGPQRADAEIQFLDAAGAIVTSRPQRDLHLNSGATNTFEGTTELTSLEAAQVVRLGVKETAR